MEARTLFIKPSRPFDREIKLDPILVSSNKARGIETTLILDTNILISIEKIVNNGNKWSSVKKKGLHNLVKFLQKCPPKSVCISPGFAFNEMPPSLAEKSRRTYEIFCSKHLPEFIDSPNCTYKQYSGKEDDYGYEDLSDEAKAVISVSFSCILYLNLIENNEKGKPIEKFKKFLDKIESKVDFLSAAEIEIAKYCFAELSTNSGEIITLRRRIRNNFLKTRDEKLPKNADEVMQIAFNGACDLNLLMTANVIDYQGLDGTKQDSWIATKDRKLVDFCSIFHHVNLDGETGKFAASVKHPDHSRDIYWTSADTNFAVRSIIRRSYHERRAIELQDLLKISEEVIAEIKAAFD